MKKIFSEWNFKKHIILSFIVSLLGCTLLAAIIKAIFLKMVAEANESVSVGIIGGADGPTAIYVSSSNTLGMYSIIVLLLFVLLLALYKPVKAVIKKWSK